MPSTENLIWIDLEMTGLKPDSDAHHRDRHRRHGQGSERHRRRARISPSTSPTRCSRGMDEWNQKQHGASGLWRGCGPAPSPPRRPSSARSRFLAPLVERRRLADVRQQHLPGPAVPRAPDARAGAVLPLPQPGREHAQGAGAPLGAGCRESFVKTGAHLALADIHDRSASCGTTARTLFAPQSRRRR